MTSASDVISLHIERPDGVRRLGQALWMMVGQPIEPSSLLWARGLLGVNGDALLWKALCEREAVWEPDFLLRPQQLASFLCSLWSNEPDTEQVTRLIWTLPPQLEIDGIAGDSYVQTVIELVESADATLTIISPYLEPKGMGWLHDSLLRALHRGVTVLILTHDIKDLSSLTSSSLEALRRDSMGLPGAFTVFTASAVPQVLLHLKIIVADQRKVIVGSANATGKGFTANLEAGVVLGQDAASEIGRVVQAAIATLANQAFSNRK